MTKAVVIVSFLAAFAAGLTVGSRMLDVPAAAQARHARSGGWLESELDLTPAQQQQMKQIWSQTLRRGGYDRQEQRRRLYRERDEQIDALIPAENREQYQEIVKTHGERLAALDREWRDAFQGAVDRTRQMLTPEQRTKYEKLLRRHRQGRGRDGANDEFEPGSSREQRVTSRPT